MSKAIATLDPIPRVGPRNPSLTNSLPLWVEERLFYTDHKRKLEEYRTTPDGRIVVTIPSRLTLSQTQRRLIEQRVSDLATMEAPGPVEEIDNAIEALISRYATARMDTQQLMARVNFYRMAIGEFPAWTVREAIARWIRGEIGQQYDRSFAPPEHVLREACKTLTMVATGMKNGLIRVLDAEPVEEPTAEEREAAIGRVAEIVKEVEEATSPEDRGPGKPKRYPESPEEQARKEQILKNPGKGILAELREKGGEHVAAE